MDIIVKQGSIQTTQADTIVVNLFEGATELVGGTGAIDRSLQGAIRELMDSGDLTGEAGQVVTIFTRGAIPARRVLVVGLGPAESFDQEAARRAAATAALKAREFKSGAGCDHRAWGRNRQLECGTGRPGSHRRQLAGAVRL